MAFNRFISEIAAGNEIEVFGDGEQRRDFTYVKDIVAGNILALGATPGRTYNVGAGKTVSLNEAIAIMEQTIGRRAKVRRREVALGDVRNTSADITRISRELGYQPKTALAEGLKMQVEAQLTPKA